MLAAGDQIYLHTSVLLVVLSNTKYQVSILPIYQPEVGIEY